MGHLRGNFVNRTAAGQYRNLFGSPGWTRLATGWQARSAGNWRPRYEPTSSAIPLTAATARPPDCPSRASTVGPHTPDASAGADLLCFEPSSKFALGIPPCPHSIPGTSRAHSSAFQRIPANGDESIGVPFRAADQFCDPTGSPSYPRRDRSGRSFALRHLKQCLPSALFPAYTASLEPAECIPARVCRRLRTAARVSEYPSEPQISFGTPRDVNAGLPPPANGDESIGVPFRAAG